MRTIKLLLALCVALVISGQLSAQDDSCDVPLPLNDYGGKIRMESGAGSRLLTGSKTPD